MLSLLIISTLMYSQKKERKFKIEYMNMSSLSVTKNTESYFQNFSKDSIKTFDGASFEMNTIHGVKFFGHVSIAAGFSIDWNINKSFMSTPLIFDLRVFSSKNVNNSFFAYLQTGQNIKWSNSFDGNGNTSKLGVGSIFDNSENVSYYFDVFKKSRVIDLYRLEEKGKYNINGFGISLGVIF